MAQANAPSLLLKVIAIFRFGNKLIFRFNYEAGNFDNGYNKIHPEVLKIFKKYNETYAFSKKDFNIFHLLAFFKSFGRSIINHFLSYFFFVWLILYGYYYFIKQIIYVFGNINGYKTESIEMVFYGRMHYFLSVLFTPIFFIINLLFIEHVERLLGSLVGLASRTVTINFKLFFQVLMILILPILGTLYIFWALAKQIIIGLKNLLRPLIKPMIFHSGPEAYISKTP